MVRVRQAERKDTEAAVGVLRRSITELCTPDHRGDADTITKWLANKTPENFLRWLANSDNFCVLAEANDRLVGVGLLHRSGEVRLCYLAPGAQGQGIGKAIYIVLEEKAKAWGLTELTLDSTFRPAPSTKGSAIGRLVPHSRDSAYRNATHTRSHCNLTP
jgi:GNAT superfamily N-acetyltransferase